MMKVIRAVVTIGVLVVAWTALVLTAALQGWLVKPLAPRDDAAAFMAAVENRAEHAGIGNCAIALIRNGRVFDTFVYSIGTPVGDRTLFQMASDSKWVTSWGVMALVEQGKLDLDAPVSRYLTRWQLPPSEFANDGVTVRRLLSHTAGLTDGLGYLGFAPGVTPQTLEESLTFAADRMPGADGHVRVGHAPGSRWQYSGGGYTLLQLLIEEVTHDSFAHYMQQTVFAPLGMADTTFDHDAAAAGNIATFYGPDLKPAIHYRFTALAAASLYSTLNDLEAFVLAHLPGPDGEPAGRGVLKAATLEAMRVPEARVLRHDIWGLGTMLYAKDTAGGYVFGHDGENYPAINHAVRIDAATRSAFIVLSTGNDQFASQLAAQWVFWETGNVDFIGFASHLTQLLRPAAIGAGMILLGGIGWFRRRRKPD
jgi:CubicO group peptidase (beta-lactamase class C family)